MGTPNMFITYIPEYDIFIPSSWLHADITELEQQRDIHNKNLHTTLNQRREIELNKKLAWLDERILIGKTRQLLKGN